MVSNSSYNVIRPRNLNCNQGISEINNLNSVNGRSNTWLCSVLVKNPLIFFHADKTTEQAATIIPVMILGGLHTDSTYQSPLRETFVKDIREDFSNLVHSSDRVILFEFIPLFDTKRKQNVDSQTSRRTSI